VRKSGWKSDVNVAVIDKPDTVSQSNHRLYTN